MAVYPNVALRVSEESQEGYVRGFIAGFANYLEITP